MRADEADIADSRDVSLTIPARPDYLVLARLALSAVCRLTPLSPEEIADLKLAITEACSNSIRHAYDEQGSITVPSGDKVYVTYLVHSDRLVVEVRDRGKGFDWSGPSDHELPEGGLGISIIQAVCDEFEVIRPPDGEGSELRITKLRRPS